MSRNTGRCGLIAIAGLLVLCALVSIPALLYQSNPPVVSQPPWDSQQTVDLARRACFDCHSNETRWPWFTKIPPGSWLAVFDTMRGRRVLNLSEWQPGAIRGERGGGVGEIGGVISEGSMPPWTYTLMHPNAVLNAQEKQQLIQGLQASLK